MRTTNPPSVRGRAGQCAPLPSLPIYPNPLSAEKLEKHLRISTFCTPQKNRKPPPHQHFQNKSEIPIFAHLRKLLAHPTNKTSLVAKNGGRGKGWNGGGGRDMLQT